MEIKDWIMLFVPIVCNGVLLFLFQFYLKRYFEKQDRVQSENLKTFQNLYTHTEHAQIAMYAFLHIRKEDNFAELFNPVAKQIHQLKMFYDANESQLKMFNLEFEKVFSEWDKLTNLLQGIVENHNGCIPPEASTQISSSADQVYKSITTILQQCRKKVIGN